MGELVKKHEVEISARDRQIKRLEEQNRALRNTLSKLGVDPSKVLPPSRDPVLFREIQEIPPPSFL